MGLFNSVGQMFDGKPGSPIEDWLRQNGIMIGQTPGYGDGPRGSLFSSAPLSRGLFASRPGADPAASPQEPGGNWHTDAPIPILAQDRSLTAPPPNYRGGAIDGMERTRLGNGGLKIGSVDLEADLAEVERYAYAIGAPNGSPGFNGSVQDFEGRASRPTAYRQNTTLEDARLRQSNTNSVLSPGISTGNSAPSAARPGSDNAASVAARYRPTAARIRANEAAAKRRGDRSGRTGGNVLDTQTTPKPEPVAERPPEANLPPAAYRSQVDPAKNAQLQAAFDRGASLGDLLKMAFSLGIQFNSGDTGSLRRAIAWRDKGGKGARIAPEAEKESLDRGGRARLVDSPAAGIAFNDELPETVASKLKPEQLALWEQVATDPKSTPAQLTSLMKGFGYDLANADAIVAARDNGLGVNKNVVYKLRQIPKNADGAIGAAARGLADPVNFLDEMGAVVDTLGVTGGRENIWNSDRPFLDVLNSNIDQNRSILQADERDHFEARFGGQLASGLLIPVGGGARTAAQFAKYGAAEGFAAGFGAGEGNLLERAPNAAVGAGLGLVGGYSLGRGVEAVSPYITRALLRRGRGSDVEAPTPGGARAGAPERFPSATEPTIRSADQRRLSEALERQEFGNVDFGRLSKAKLERINTIRDRLGQPILQDRRLVIPANVVRKLYEKRVLMDGMTPDEVADLVFSVFHADKSQPAASRHPHIQALINAREGLSRIGFIAENPMTGETVVKSAYPTATDRLPKAVGSEAGGTRDIPPSAARPKPGYPHSTIF